MNLGACLIEVFEAKPSALTTEEADFVRFLRRKPRGPVHRRLHARRMKRVEEEAVKVAEEEGVTLERDAAGKIDWDKIKKWAVLLKIAARIIKIMPLVLLIL